MGQKNDLVIERLAKRLGKLSRRNTALAQWAMQAEAKATKAERLASLGGRRVKELTDQIHTMDQDRAALIAAASAQLHEQIKELTADNMRLRRGAPWPSAADIAASRQVQWTPGVEYVSPHLVGYWKCVEVHVHGTGTFWRMGSDPQQTAPQIIVDRDNAMCFTEAPF